MMEAAKCECGHLNPAATVLCEACGKPLEEESDGADAPLPMRYDGTVRRSQRKDAKGMNRVWRFFSSVKTAVWLIAATLVLSTLGTVLPQENTLINTDPAVYYEESYGAFGQAYYRLGLSRTYESWWFVTLIMLIGASLVICSLDRVLPLYRALSRQQIRKHPSFIRHQKVSYSGPVPDSGHGHAGASGPWLMKAEAALRKKGYRVLADKEEGALMAEKHRFSRWGPYIHHIGLILFLGAVLARGIPGWHMDQYIGFPEGEPVNIPETPYYLMNEQFSVDYYEDNPEVPKRYETRAVLYSCTADCDDAGKLPVLEQVHDQAILVNKPLRYKGLLAYQFDFRENPMLLSLQPVLRDKSTGRSLGSFQLSMRHPQSRYTAGDYVLELTDYYPDFALDENGRPVTRSKDPLAPAFVFLIKGPDLPADGAVYMYFPRAADQERFRQDDLNGSLAGRLELAAGDMEKVKVSYYTSYLNIRRDKAMPLIWTGAGVSMLGLVMGFYWQHRRIWLRVDDGVLLWGAHTNKNWFGLRKECAWLLERTGITADSKSLERGRAE